MSLQQKLSRFKTQFQSGLPPFEGVPAAAHEILQRATTELLASGIAERIRASGPAPEFALADTAGEIVALRDLLADGPLVLGFFRGSWCPYCNLELQELQRFAGEIGAAGARLAVITPQAPSNSRKLAAEHGITFPMLSDTGNRVADAFGLRYRLPEYQIALFRQLGVSLPAFNGDESWTLPIPARFVIDRAGQIRHAEANPDYTQRPEPESVLPLLAALRHDAAA